MELLLVLPPLHQQQMLLAALFSSLLVVSPVCSWPFSRCERGTGKDKRGLFGETYSTMSIE